MNIKLILLIVLIFIPGAIGAQEKKADEPKAVREIRAVLDKQVEAWNQRNLEEFMVGYWKSPNLSFFSGGTKTSSWQDTIERYRKTYQGEGREMGRLDFSEIQIELLGKDAAFVRGKWHLKMSASDPGGLFTLIFRKMPEGWRIIHDHTSTQ